MKIRHDLITNFLFEANGQFDEQLYEKLEEFSRYAINRYKVYIVVAACCPIWILWKMRESNI